MTPHPLGCGSSHEGKFNKEYQTIIIHGAYDGDMSSCSGCPRELNDLWTRLETPTDHFKNFRVMEQKGYKVMVRGHDHDANYVYEDPKKGIVEYEPKADGNTIYRLFKHRKHTINPGALFDGKFAVIDTNVPGEEVPSLTYFDLDSSMQFFKFPERRGK